MAVYKLYPTKDATIYSFFPALNTGTDEILEATTNNTLLFSGEGLTSRFLIQFSTNEITDVITNKISGSIWSSSLKLFLADATGLNEDTTLKIFPISSSWNMGTGKYLSQPQIENGVSWAYRSTSGSNSWISSSFPTNVTASYSNVVGGGTWYFNNTSSQILSYSDSKDINADVTNIVNVWKSGSIVNNGFIIKQDTEFVSSSVDSTSLKFFSIDTHTIYPPCLEFKWRDYSFNTGSTIFNTLSLTPIVSTISENPGTFNLDSINNFRINSRPKYPTRTFSTSSVYTVNYLLPTSSYYAIKDLDTNEFVVDFDSQFTQISADSNGNYFKLYMNGLEPERNYKILIKTIINGNTLILDDNYYFKIINGQN